MDVPGKTFGGADSSSYSKFDVAVDEAKIESECVSNANDRVKC
jgi:hypothetical protein